MSLCGIQGCATSNAASRQRCSQPAPHLVGSSVLGLLCRLLGAFPRALDLHAGSSMRQWRIAASRGVRQAMPLAGRAANRQLLTLSAAASLVSCADCLVPSHAPSACTQQAAGQQNSSAGGVQNAAAWGESSVPATNLLTCRLCSAGCSLRRRVCSALGRLLRVLPLATRNRADLQSQKSGGAFVHSLALQEGVSSYSVLAAAQPVRDCSVQAAGPADQPAACTPRPSPASRPYPYRRRVVLGLGLVLLTLVVAL